MIVFTSGRSSRPVTEAMLRGALVPTGLLLPLAALGGWLADGPAGAGSAVFAVVLVAGFFTVGFLGVREVVKLDGGLSLIGALLVYGTQLGILMLVLVLARDAPWVREGPVVVAAVAATLAWQGGLTAGWLRGRHQVYDLEREREDADRGQAGQDGAHDRRAPTTQAKEET